jgi:hypothetical protein
MRSSKPLYVIVTADTLDQLARQVNAQGEHGYHPVGGPVTEQRDGHTSRFAQAMRLHEQHWPPA